ncbi:histidine--tRNA ligase [Candidatus Kaiserbacteria bacterium RIFCSPHIGHO2_01_FULL_51_33]|uniref:Histidine--tRNA ligase n=1 Tax=Candidatus Kaiserbacteria bacterium RIFCSPLOWO2_01_FULL_51_21 TaxID=1798508 RepID=A0A1F6EDQ1_9BACT|nr:MAG: histidine--tRNA ligase [Candidatus Kaiserbacteria bacterium RIFCSPHIGHO2_01_FULL_51_33]OGG71784.1 MAG: histidine--tRNA ligase [Candidatus Kaiserbacteria bacterium RIFCSPLOWO2_01_FULL_51_21]
MSVIKARKLGGFLEFNPAEQRVLEDLKLKILQAYESFGFVPIETCAVEPKEVLTAKGGSIDKQIYAVSRLVGEVELNASLEEAIKRLSENGAPSFLESYLNADSLKEFKFEEEDSDDVKVLKVIRGLVKRSQTDMALHFDLTIPFAHYVAKYKNELVFPFRRYQMQKVWRGERQQSGRYREFYQCDIDVIGRGELSLLADAEMPSIISQIFDKMNIGRFVTRISNAKIQQEYFRYAGVPEELLVVAKDAIDELGKVGVNRTVTSLSVGTGISTDRAREVVGFVTQSGLSSDDLLKKLATIPVSDRYRTGLAELGEVMEGVRVFGVPDTQVRVDLSVARGLDYYTSTVYETVLVDQSGVGSVCGGGRYDDLASYYTDEKFPGVGISIGLTRLVARLIGAKLVEPKHTATASVLVTTLGFAHMPKYTKIARQLRAADINTELYLGLAPIGKQLQYANRKGFQLAIIAGDREFDRNCVQIRNLVTGKSGEYLTDSIVTEVNYILGLIREGR